MSSRGFSVEDSDEENDYENHVTRKPNRFRKSYYDEDDDDNDVNGRYIRSNSRRNHRDDNDEDEPRYSRQSSNVRRSGENFVPKSLDRDREYDQNTRSVRQPTTAWASGRREDRSDTDPDNGRSWNRAAPRGDRRDSNPDKRASWRAPSDDEDDRPRSRNGYHQSSERPNRPPPRGDRPVNNYSRRNYDEEDSPNQYGGVREESRSRSNSNSHRPPPREYSEDENDYNRTPHQSHQQIVRRPQREFESTRESTPTIDDDLLSDDGNGADHIKQEHDLHDRQVVDVAGVMRLGNSISFVSLCPANGGTTDLVQCVILRDRMNLVEGTLYPTYKLYLENKMKLLITAQKMNLNTTSNYHLFDMTRGTLGGTLSKKSGNYLGKLRAHDSHRTEYSIVTRAEEREEVGAVIFERVGIINQLKEGCQPRKMTVLVPNLNAESEPIPHKVIKKFGQKKSLVDMIKNSETGRMFLLKSKEPVYENGNYRLNFHGRVSVPSVKNFQLSSPDDPAHVVCQFGKVGEDRFHLDYKAPLNAFQAFSIALCHFDT